MGKGRRSIKTIEKLCGHCKQVVDETKDEFIECDKCAKTFHVLCTKLDKCKYDFFLQNEDEEFTCNLCDSGGDFKAELEGIKAELRKLDQLQLLQQSMDFMAKQFDGIIKGVAENKKQLDMLQKKNKSVKVEVKTLKTSIKVINDERCKYDCIITGLAASPDSSATDTVLKLINEAGEKLQEDSINEAYFIKNRNNNIQKKQMLVVKFNSRKSKDVLMSVKPKLKEDQDTKSVFVRDFLSRETLSLLSYARALKNVGYHSVYAASGRIFVKKGEMSKPKLVHSQEDVDSLLLEATTNMQTKCRALYQRSDEDEAILL